MQISLLFIELIYFLYLKRNNEIINHQEIHSAKFPINIASLSSEQKFVVMYGPENLAMVVPKSLLTLIEEK